MAENKRLINLKGELIKEKELLFNKEIEKKNNKIQDICPKKEININYEGIKKIKKVNKLIIEHNNEYQILKEEKDDDSESGEQNKKIGKLNMVKDVILSNYLNTINIGYNKNFDSDYNNEDFINNINNECEPIPSFLLCLQKEKD